MLGCGVALIALRDHGGIGVATALPAPADFACNAARRLTQRALVVAQHDTEMT
jgi:hypothetical protein